MSHRSVLLSAGASLALSLVALSGCGAADTQPKGEESVDATPAASASADPDKPKWSDKASNKEKDEDLNQAQREQMEIALRRGGDKAANCASVVPDGPRGEGEVKVTFDGKKGRATDVSVGPPWAGTAVESCIKRSFVGEIIVPFEGELEVPYTVKIGVKDDKKGDKGAKVDKNAKGKDPKKK